jgi:hypothetical protein
MGIKVMYKDKSVKWMHFKKNGVWYRHIGARGKCFRIKSETGNIYQPNETEMMSVEAEEVRGKVVVKNRKPIIEW